MEKNTQKPKESLESFAKRYIEKLGGSFEEMLEMKFPDFQKEAVERFKNLYGAMLAIIDIFPKEKKRFDNFTNVFAKELHERDEIICNAFKKLDEKLEPIAFTVMLLSLKAKKGPVTQKDREEVSEMFGYVWDDESERDFLDTIRV